MTDIRLDRLSALPDRLADITAREIKTVFPNPTLVTIQGEIDPPLFISTLLHGNETTSFTVLQHLQRQLKDAPPHRSLKIFIGNVEAASHGLRHLDDAPDFNRIWSQGDTPYHHLTAEILDEVRHSGLFASIDIHNNTGKNPIYGCVNALRSADLQLAEMFAPVGVYYLNPPTTQSIAFSHLCPSVTVECGQSNEPEGVEAAIRLVEGVMALDHFDSRAPSDFNISLYQTVGRVLIDPDASFTFGPGPNDLSLRSDLEALNFKPLKSGDRWAETRFDRFPLKVVDEHGTDLTDHFFRQDGNNILLTQDATPSMVTLDTDIIRQDCLCYLMTPMT